MKMLIASLLALVAAGPVSAADIQPIDYRFDAVKRNVMLFEGGQTQKPATPGLIGHSGDRVQTGWFSSARIAADRYQARFEIFSATDVTLTAGTPGVLISVDRGRIRAAFDKIIGNEPRIVKTPGALLAVRGTQFDVEVAETGDTVVSVFEGIVEVRSPLRPEPLFVRPGEQSRFGEGRPPLAEPMSDERRRRAPDGTIDRAHPENPGNAPGEGMRPGERPDGGRPGSQPGQGGMGPGSGMPGGMSPGSPAPGGQQPPPQRPPVD